MTSTGLRESGQYPNEYWFSTQKVGVIDRSDMARLRIIGVDSLDLLDRLSTNALLELVPGSSLHTVMTTNKGRIACLLLVASLGDQLILMTGRRDGEKASELIDFYTFSEDVSVQDVSSQTMMFSLVGPDSSVLLTEIPDMETYTNLSTTIEGTPTIIYRMNHTKYYLIVESQLGNKLAEILTSRGATKITDEVQELIRIETATAGYNTELNEKFNPLETGL